MSLLPFALALAATPQARTSAANGEMVIPQKDGSSLSMPLKGTDVRAEIAGFAARVTVVQTFQNPSKVPIEAIYTFPLPEDAAVDRMRIRIGDRVIEGDVKRRAEARAIYEAARNQGFQAALLDQERPNIFTQSVANLMPGRPIEVEISYVHLVKFVDGEFQFHFPMTVGPRYAANAPDPDRISPPIVEEGKRTGADIRVQVDILSAAPIEGLQSDLHQVDIHRMPPAANSPTQRTAVQLRKQNEIPNRDFILRWRTRESGVSSQFLTHADRTLGGFFTLVLIPPKTPRLEMIAPKEIVFVVDQSGSQSGLPIEKSKELSRKLIETLGPNDTFNVMGFSNQVNLLWPNPRPNTEENRAEAIRWLNRLDANGGTELWKAVQAALVPKRDPERLRMVLFNTDGFIGDEARTLGLVQKHRGDARMFVFGIGNSVNRFLVESMAVEGLGAAEIVTLNDRIDEKVDRFVKRSQSPVLTDIEVTAEGVEIQDLQPTSLPDVFADSPVVLYGRYTRPGKGRLVLRGRLGGEPWTQVVNVDLPAQDRNGSAIASMWARQRIESLSRERYMASVGGPDAAARSASLEAQITDVALRFRLMSEYTSFVAVEARVVNVGGKTRTIRVPIEMADGVSYHGMVDAAAVSPLSFGAPSKQLLRSPRAPYAAPGHLPVGASAAGGFGGGSVLREELRSLEPMPRVSPEALRDRIRKLLKAPSEEIREVAGMMTPDQETKVLAMLTASERRAYRLHTRVAPKLLKAEGPVEVTVLVESVTPEILAAFTKAGMKVYLSDPSGRFVAGSVEASALGDIAELKGVRRIQPME